MKPDAATAGTTRTTLTYVGLGAALLWTLFPIYWTVATSLKTDPDLVAIPPVLFPETFDFGAYGKVVQRGIPQLAINSLIVSTGTTIISLVIAIPGSYGLTRLGLPRRIGLSIARVIGFGAMLPAIAIVVPLFQLAVALKAYDQLPTLIALNVPFNAAFGVWLLRTVWMDVPRNLEEAALIDGDTRFSAFFRILLPMMRHSLIAVAVLIFILSWNEYLFALVFTTSPRAETLPIGIAAQIPQHELSWQIVAAVGSLALIPVILATALLQRYLVRGLTFGLAR